MRPQNKNIPLFIDCYEIEASTKGSVNKITNSLTNESFRYYWNN